MDLKCTVEGTTSVHVALRIPSTNKLQPSQFFIDTSTCKYTITCTIVHKYMYMHMYLKSQTL